MVESWAEDEDDDGQCIEYLDLTDVEIGVGECCFVYRSSIEADHRFYIYEDADLDRLAGWIGRLES